MSKLLPPNVSPLERRLAETCSGISDLTVDLRTLWNPAACPAAFLPYLAWAFSVDSWDDTWPERIKRKTVQDAFFVHQHKGTVSALRRVIEPFGSMGSIEEWWQSSGVPGTFTLDINVRERGITEQTYFELERLIDGARPVSRHLVGLSISLASAGNIFTGAGSYSGDTLTIYPKNSG